MAASFDIDLGFNKSAHVIVTGAAGHIGSIVVQAFLAAGCSVTAIDVKKNHGIDGHERLRYAEADITDEKRLEEVFEDARRHLGPITTCIAVAGLDLSYIEHHSSLVDMSLEQWQRTTRVNVDGTFLTARTWLRHIRDHAEPESRNMSLILFGSEAGLFGVVGNADYATSKAAIHGMAKTLAGDVTRINGRCRVNAIAPGPVDTAQFRHECKTNPQTLWTEAHATVAMKSAVPLEAIARCCLFLASDNFSGHITGQVIPVDSGKNGKLFWDSNSSAF